MSRSTCVLWLCCLLAVACAAQPSDTPGGGGNPGPGGGNHLPPGDGDGDGDLGGNDNDAGIPNNNGGGQTDAGQDAGTAPNPSRTLLPWRTGNTWTYRVTNNGVTSMKVTTVGPEEQVGGSGPNATRTAFKITTTKGPNDKTESWQAVEGDRVIRYRELSFSASTGLLALEEHWAPHKLHIDSSPERTKAGASWVETFQETKRMPDGSSTTATVSDTWIVDGVDVQVTVPAGTFRAIVLQKSGGVGGVKTYWYVPGVGKVKETGGQTEELVSYDLVEDSP